MYRIVRYWDNIPINIRHDNIHDKTQLMYLWSKHGYSEKKHGYSGKISEKVFLLENGKLTLFKL